MKDRHWPDIFNAICSSVTALAALFALIVVLYPQIKPSNVNHIELANAGVVDSQIFLANHYYRIGNLSESVYWYSIASQAEGEHQAKAINNLACIYLTTKNFNATQGNIFINAMNMFQAAADLGEIDAAKNLYILLIANPPEQFGTDYAYVLETSKEILIENNIDLTIFDRYQAHWEYVETNTGDCMPADNETYQYRMIDADYVLSEGKMHWVYTYSTYQKVSATEEPKYNYANITT